MRRFWWSGLVLLLYLWGLQAAEMRSPLVFRDAVRGVVVEAGTNYDLMVTGRLFLFSIPTSEWEAASIVYLDTRYASESGMASLAQLLNEHLSSSVITAHPGAGTIVTCSVQDFVTSWGITSELSFVDGFYQLLAGGRELWRLHTNGRVIVNGHDLMDDGGNVLAERMTQQLDQVYLRLSGGEINGSLWIHSLLQLGVVSAPGKVKFIRPGLSPVWVRGYYGPGSSDLRSPLIQVSGNDNDYYPILHSGLTNADLEGGLSLAGDLHSTGWSFRVENLTLKLTSSYPVVISPSLETPALYVGQIFSSTGAVWARGPGGSIAAKGNDPAGAMNLIFGTGSYTHATAVRSLNLGGSFNRIEAFNGDGVLLGGQYNTLSYYGNRNSVIGGLSNQIRSTYYYVEDSAILGGRQNAILQNYPVSDSGANGVLAGESNLIRNSQCSLALGQGAEISGVSNSFYWSCGGGPVLTQANTFAIWVPGPTNVLIGGRPLGNLIYEDSASIGTTHVHLGQITADWFRQTNVMQGGYTAPLWVPALTAFVFRTPILANTSTVWSAPQYFSEIRSTGRLLVVAAPSGTSGGGTQLVLMVERNANTRDGDDILFRAGDGGLPGGPHGNGGDLVFEGGEGGYLQSHPSYGNPGGFVFRQGPEIYNRPELNTTPVIRVYDSYTSLLFRVDRRYTWAPHLVAETASVSSLEAGSASATVVRAATLNMQEGPIQNAASIDWYGEGIWLEDHAASSTQMWYQWNADLLDGRHASYFASTGHTHEGEVSALWLAATNDFPGGGIYLPASTDGTNLYWAEGGTPTNQENWWVAPQHFHSQVTVSNDALNWLYGLLELRLTNTDVSGNRPAIAFEGTNEYAGPIWRCSPRIRMDRTDAEGFTNVLRSYITAWHDRWEMDSMPLSLPEGLIVSGKQATAIIFVSTNYYASTSQLASVQSQVDQNAQDISVLQTGKLDLSEAILWSNSLHGEIQAVSNAAVLDGDAAGGDLSGTYPNPSLAADSVGIDELATTNAAAPDLVLGVDASTQLHWTAVSGGGSPFRQLYEASFYATGGPGNYVTGHYCAVLSGRTNRVDGNNGNSYDNVICGGHGNVIKGSPSYYSFIGGGYANMVQGNYLSIVGGYNNRMYAMSPEGSTIAGGRNNLIYQWAAHAWINGYIAAGENNTLYESCTNSTISGGAYNRIDHATYCWAGGWRTKTTNSGVFIWQSYDAGTNIFESTATNQFLINCPGGGVGINTNNNDGKALNVGGDMKVDRIYFRQGGYLYSDGTNLHFYNATGGHWQTSL